MWNKVNMWNKVKYEDGNGKYLEMKAEREHSEIPQGTSNGEESVSVVGSGISFVGKITGEGPVRVFGLLEGEIHASSVVIGVGAKVVGNVVTQEISISGRLKGEITAEKVRLLSSGEVEGEISSRILSIEENAVFRGSSRGMEKTANGRGDIPSE